MAFSVSDKEFVQDMLYDANGLGELPHYICIDWDATTDTIMTDYSEHDGHYFQA